jgi:hypothetical protein
LDIDQGMVLKMGDRLYYGSDAIHALALISSRSGIFNRLNCGCSIQDASLHQSSVFRNLLLKLLRRTKINNLGLENNDRF